MRDLLRRVAARERMCSVAERFYLFLLLLCVLYGVLLLCSRLLAIIPNWFVPLNLVSVTATALALAIAFHRRPAPRTTARLIDKRMQTDDLFLSAVLIESALGAYKPLVLEAAEDRAGIIEPKRVVPFRWAARARNATLALVALLAAVMFLPQLDPFGREQQRQQAARQRRQLERSRKATLMRVALLKKKNTGAELSEEVRRALGELKLTLNAMRPNGKQGNLKRLTEERAKLGTLWREVGEKKLKDAFRRTQQTQRFGSGQGQKAERWRQQLRKGQTESVRKAIEELKDAVQRLAQTRDSAEKRRLAAQVEKALEALRDLAGGQVSSKALAAAVDRALQQLAMAGIEGLAEEALQALLESLDLTQIELDSLAQSVRDLRSLEEALSALQLARLLNDLELLDGQACSGCKSMADYAALYAKLMAGRCCRCGGKLDANGVCAVCGARGSGPGMRGPGTGVGGLAPEDAEAETSFKTERSRSALSAGKILLSLKTKGLSDPGKAIVEYERRLKDVKQGISEAILQERVPPAYQEAIRRYFDAMGEGHEGAGAK